jgi:hypothetical protein
MEKHSATTTIASGNPVGYTISASVEKAEVVRPNPSVEVSSVGLFSDSGGIPPSLESAISVGVSVMVSSGVSDFVGEGAGEGARFFRLIQSIETKSEEGKHDYFSIQARSRRNSKAPHCGKFRVSQQTEGTKNFNVHNSDR